MSKTDTPAAPAAPEQAAAPIEKGKASKKENLPTKQKTVSKKVKKAGKKNIEPAGKPKSGPSGSDKAKKAAKPGGKAVSHKKAPVSAPKDKAAGEAPGKTAAVRAVKEDAAETAAAAAARPAGPVKKAAGEPPRKSGGRRDGLRLGGAVTAFLRSDTGKKLAAKAPAFDYEQSLTEPDFWRNVKRRVLSSNPVLVKAAALVPILGAAVSLKSGILISCAMFITVLVSNLVMYPLWRAVPRRFRLAAALVVSGAVVSPVCLAAGYLAPTSAAACGIYLPLVAVCALPLIEKRHYKKRFGFAKTALDAALDGLGFAFAAIIFSMIREIFANGTLYDRPLPYIAGLKFPVAALPVGAFVLMGLLVALFRKIYGFEDDGEGTK